MAGAPRSKATDGAERKNNSKEKVSERETWWRSSLTESPVPGTYHIRSFIEDAAMNPVRKTYGFKGEGRKKYAGVLRKGDLLLPGAYAYADFLQHAEKQRVTYSFRSCTRSKCPIVGVTDKDVNISPCQYNLMEKPVIKTSCKHVMFRSAVQRFPTIYFVPKEGPAPGQYEVRVEQTHPNITSCFRSAVPRLPSTRSKTPGPGTYEPMKQMPVQPITVTAMGRLHGLFFRNSFEF
ncbi:protein STPG4 [Erpetoichthys calabaricus]|nr:protein STPG4 [Erpetoichthys calabaricus]